LFSIVAGVNVCVISVASVDFALRWRQENSTRCLNHMDSAAIPVVANASSGSTGTTPALSDMQGVGAAEGSSQRPVVS